MPTATRHYLTLNLGVSNSFVRMSLTQDTLHQPFLLRTRVRVDYTYNAYELRIIDVYEYTYATTNALGVFCAVQVLHV